MTAFINNATVIVVLSISLLLMLQFFGFHLNCNFHNPGQALLRQKAVSTTSQQQSCPPSQNEPHMGHKRVLVTGGAGFIGSHVSEFLLERGDTVIVVDEMNSYYNVSIKEANLEILRRKAKDKKQLSIYKGDVADEIFMKDVFEKERPEWICHMAARAGVRPSIDEPFVYIHSNVEGTTRLLELSRQYKVKNFVFASSSSVYGESSSRIFDEATSVDDRPISPYAATKKATELLSYTFHHLYDLNVTGLRFFTVYGPRGRPDMAPFKFIDRISRGLQIEQYGHGDSMRDYTYISDIVQGIVRAMDRPQPAFEVLNLGKGVPNSLRDFIQTVENATGKRANIVVKQEQPGDVPYTCSNVTKAYCLLGYNPTVSLEQGIGQTVEWYNATYQNN